jgi:hypothetical protein
MHNICSLRVLFFLLPKYLWGDWKYCRKEHERQNNKSHPHFLFFQRKIKTKYKWMPPILDVSILDGYGESIGYPRHHCYFVFFWNTRGYAIGIEFKK